MGTCMVSNFAISCKVLWRSITVVESSWSTMFSC
jgi:hypothetical protein